MTAATKLHWVLNNVTRHKFYQFRKQLHIDFYQETCPSTCGLLKWGKNVSINRVLSSLLQLENLT